MPGGSGELSVRTWSHPRYGWIIIPLEVGGLFTLAMVLSTSSPLSYIRRSASETLAAVGLARDTGENRCVLRDVSIHGQTIPDLPVRIRQGVFPTTDGILGLDLLRQFSDIHFNVPTLRLTLTDP